MSLLSKFSKKTPEVTSVEEALAGSVSPAKSKNRKSDKRHSDAEQLIPETKRARRRLIGAIVMVLAVVIGLPMVLDTEPQALNKNIAIQIPAKEESIISSAEKDKAPESDTIEQNSKDPSLPVADALSKSKPAEAKVAESAASSTSTKPSAGDQVKKESTKKNTDDSTRALAILNGDDSANNANKPTSARIVVQIGAFATQEKVNELRSKLSSAGIKSYTQKVATSSGDKIRVRVGPFEDKETAGKVKKQLEKLGLNGTLLTL